jgi:hypothetical protein
LWQGEIVERLKFLGHEIVHMSRRQTFEKTGTSQTVEPETNKDFSFLSKRYTSELVQGSEVGLTVESKPNTSGEFYVTVWINGEQVMDETTPISSDFIGTTLTNTARFTVPSDDSFEYTIAGGVVE